MKDKSKCDLELGKRVQDYLIKKGVETPMTINLGYTHANHDMEFNKQSKIISIEKSVTEIMLTLGLDLKDDSLCDTPKRVAKMYVNEIFSGLDYNNFPKITTVQNKMDVDQMVLERDINVQSNCEHHLIVINGLAHVAYIPKTNGKVLGLSKINRIVEFFAKRPQIQERLASQIYWTLEFLLETEDIAVIVDAEHFCVKSRGVEDTCSSTVTSKLGGTFKDPEVRQELLTLINLKHK